MHITPNFTLGELTFSNKARLHAIDNTPDQIEQWALERLAKTTLQPIRDLMNRGVGAHNELPITVSSGFRCPELNRRVGGSSVSQHMMGEAADIKLDDRFLRRKSHESIRNFFNAHIERASGAEPNPKRVNGNYYLFCAICLNLDTFDIDQVIFEHGSPGKPDWVHVASSNRRNKREILFINSIDRRVLSLDEALSLWRSR